MVIFDNDLSPSQMRVLTEELGVQVLDRSGLILDIFAQRAQTREGRLQVELAQYQYLLPRLTGMWTHLTRQTPLAARAPSAPAVPAKPSWKPTAATSAAKSTSCERSWRTVRRVRGTQRQRRDEKRNARWWPLWVTPTRAKSTLLNALTVRRHPSQQPAV